RLYHPETGRFTTRDPHPTPLNKYQAFNANPVEHTDPTGNISFTTRHARANQRKLQNHQRRSEAIDKAHADWTAERIFSQREGHIPGTFNAVRKNLERTDRHVVHTQDEATPYMKTFLFRTDYAADDMLDIFRSIRSAALANAKFSSKFKGACKTASCAVLASAQSGKIVVPVGNASWTGNLPMLGGGESAKLAQAGGLNKVMHSAQNIFERDGVKDFLVRMYSPLEAHAAPLTFRFDGSGKRTDDKDLAKGYLIDSAMNVIKDMPGGTPGNDSDPYGAYTTFELYAAPILV
uniref:RHS repeat-associated core domain-containing protein n=1 Tax=Streptomyces sp. NRRL F-2664 TaxID=1463842 RepID=UPI0018FE621B